MKLSEFDRIECICVDNRRNEWQVLEKQFKERDANVRRFIVGKGKILKQEQYSRIDEEQLPADNIWGQNFTKNAYHCHMAHRAILENAKADGVKNILMLEDDCQLLPNFDEILDKSTEQIKELDLKWDMLYYGCNHTWGRTTQVSPNIFKLNGGSYCWHCVGINQEHHDVLGHLLNFPIEGPFDWLTAMHTQTNKDLNCYAIWPTIAIQKPGMSYVVGGIQDYTGYFENKGH